jgi:hypothetical protein
MAALARRGLPKRDAHSEMSRFEVITVEPRRSLGAQSRRGRLARPGRGRASQGRRR